MEIEERRMKSVELAFRYAEYENKVNPNKHTYFSSGQIIGLAQKIEDFIRTGE